MKVLNYIIVASLLISCGRYAEKETFYINKGYTGTIAIVFGENDGVPKEYQDGRRIYRIPESGVLYTQFPMETGILNQKYYYIEPSGNIVEEIPSLALPILEIDKYDTNRIYALIGFSGATYKNAKANQDRTNYSNENAEKVEYIYFMVGQASMSDSLKGGAYKFMERVREIYPRHLK
jgi:hypothetical protein